MTAREGGGSAAKAVEIQDKGCVSPPPRSSFGLYGTAAFQRRKAVLLFQSKNAPPRAWSSRRSLPKRGRGVLASWKGRDEDDSGTTQPVVVRPAVRARVSLTLRLICGYLLRSLLPFLTCIYETLLDLEI